MPDRETPAVRPGDHVQVWNRYVDAWAGDFEVVESRPDGVRVRPRSDYSKVLPRVLRRELVRAAEPGRFP
jgi:hypothetical protein